MTEREVDRLTSLTGVKVVKIIQNGNSNMGINFHIIQHLKKSKNFKSNLTKKIKKKIQKKNLLVAHQKSSAPRLSITSGVIAVAHYLVRH